MRGNRTLITFLGDLSEKSVQELRSFLAFSERQTGSAPSSVTEELMISLTFFNATSLRPN